MGLWRDTESVLFSLWLCFAVLFVILRLFGFFFFEWLSDERGGSKEGATPKRNERGCVEGR